MTAAPDPFELGYEAGRASRVTHPLTDEQRREAVRLLRPYVLAQSRGARGAPGEVRPEGTGEGPDGRTASPTAAGRAAS